MNPPSRTILHADLDAFFASVEQLDRPELINKAVLVGSDSRRGVVAAASYEARVYGCRSAMPMAKAKSLCPSAIIVPPRFDRYSELSEGFMEILHRFSPDIEPLSLDEAFLDITGSIRLLGSPKKIGSTLRQAVQSELGLIASVGIAPTKMAAKIASDIEKPDGFVCVLPSDLLSFLHPLPVSRLWGVGSVTLEKLERIGIRTIGDIATSFPLALNAVVGKRLGEHLTFLSRGYDPRPVQKRENTRSIGHEHTFEQDCGNKRELHITLRAQSDKVASRLRRSRQKARTVVLKIRFGDFRLVTRRRTLERATHDENIIAATAQTLLDSLAVSNASPKTRVRLTGVSVTNMENKDAPEQLAFDETHSERRERLGKALDDIAERFPKVALARAERLSPKS